MTEFSDLKGKTLLSIQRMTQDADGAEDRIFFLTADGKKYVMYHGQDCCESVTIESVVGDFADLIGSPITLAEASESREPPEGSQIDESDTWTFYKLATVKGYVDIRWHGSSNGYYSESVDFEEEKL